MSTTDFGDPHQTIHILARDLTGPRDAKLAELDLLLAQLQVVRLALCGQVVHVDGFAAATGERRRDARGPGSRLARRVRNLANALASRTGRHAKGGQS